MIICCFVIIIILLNTVVSGEKLTQQKMPTGECSIRNTVSCQTVSDYDA